MPQTMRHMAGCLLLPARSKWPKFAGLTAVAVIGSCVYGGSLSLVLETWSLASGALWLALSAGLAWCVFIPCLWRVSGLRLEECLYACLVAMAGGEVVLTAGALVNGLMAWRGATAHAVLVNAVAVAISNVAMLALLAALLRWRGIAVGKTAALWVLVLNGTGALFFALLYLLLAKP